jgi:hypothetical protein
MEVIETNNMFSEIEDNNNSEKIIEKIKKGELNDILNKFCFIDKNAIIINYIYFKYLATEQTYSFILIYITNIIDTILLNNNELIIYINTKKLTLFDIDKHKIFIQNISCYFQEKYPDKLKKCYVYNAPFVFKHFFNIMSAFIDKKTIDKIELVK